MPEPTIDAGPVSATGVPQSSIGESQHVSEKVRRYAAVVSFLMMIVCNGIVLLGLWGAGFTFGTIFTSPDLFHPDQDVCLRMGWQKLDGMTRPVQLCSEWINLSDPSGNTHTFQRDTQVMKGADGRIYMNPGWRMELRLLAFGTFLLGVIACGLWAKRRLITRYRLRIEHQGAKMAPVIS
jgi:hypothetical protein